MNEKDEGHDEFIHGWMSEHLATGWVSGGHFEVTAHRLRGRWRGWSDDPDGVSLGPPYS